MLDWRILRHRLVDVTPGIFRKHFSTSGIGRFCDRRYCRRASFYAVQCTLEYSAVYRKFKIMICFTVVFSSPHREGAKMFSSDRACKPEKRQCEDLGLQCSQETVTYSSRRSPGRRVLSSNSPD